MKKRILSLALAFAMMATAIVVPGAKAEAAVPTSRVSRFMVGEKLPGGAGYDTVTGGAINATTVGAQLEGRLRYKSNGSVNRGVVWNNANPDLATTFMVGDTLSVNMDSVNAGATDAFLYIRDRAGVQGDIKDNINVAWLFYDEDGDFVKAEEGDSYTITGDDIDLRVAAVFWVPTGSNNNTSGVTGIAAQFKNNDSRRGAVVSEFGYDKENDEISATGLISVITKNTAQEPGYNYNGNAIVLRDNGTWTDANNLIPGFIWGYVTALTTNAITVGTSEGNENIFTLESAEVKVRKNAGDDASNNSHKLYQEGNTIYMSTNDNGAGADTWSETDIYNTLELKFSGAKEYFRGEDYAGNEKGTAKDDLFWGLSKVREKTGKSYLADGTMYTRDGAHVWGAGLNQAGEGTYAENTNTDATGNAYSLSEGVYDIYVQVRNRASAIGSKYDISGAPIKTKYQLVVVDATPTKWVRLDLQLGDDFSRPDPVAGVSRATMNGNNVSMGYTRLGFTDEYVASVPSNRPYIYLPNYVSKTNEETRDMLFFQGWSTNTSEAGLLRSSGNTDIKVTLYASNKYYAIWGSTPKAPNNAVYRVFNPATTEHLYTGSLAEYAALVKAGWNGEGVKLYGYTNNNQDNDNNNNPSVDTKTKEIRRYFNRITGEHIYLESNGLEANTLVATGNWVAEKVIFVAPANGDPVYRLFNPAAPAVGQHLYTKDAGEMNILISRYGWKYEQTPFDSAVQTWNQ